MKSIVPEYKSANSRYQRLDVGGGSNDLETRELEED